MVRGLRFGLVRTRLAPVSTAPPRTPPAAMSGRDSADAEQQIQPE